MARAAALTLSGSSETRIDVVIAKGKPRVDNPPAELFEYRPERLSPVLGIRNKRLPRLLGIRNLSQK